MATTEAGEPRFRAPQEWTTPGETPCLVPVQSDSAEYKRVDKHFQSASEHRDPRRVVRVERVENRELYRRYSAYRDRVAAKCNSRVRSEWKAKEDKPVERYVWHGTSKNDPKCIYGGVEGFAMKYASYGGWYGYGLYFAEEAFYSCEFAHPVIEDGKQRFQIFLAMLVTGMTQEHGSMGSGDRYDSIRINKHADATLWLVTVDNAAYPMYLVTFEGRSML